MKIQARQTARAGNTRKVSMLAPVQKHWHQLPTESVPLMRAEGAGSNVNELFRMTLGAI